MHVYVKVARTRLLRLNKKYVMFCPLIELVIDRDIKFSLISLILSIMQQHLTGDDEQ